MEEKISKGEITAQKPEVQSEVSVFNENIKCDSIPLYMTQEEFEGVDFCSLTSELLVDYIKAFGQVYILSRKYKVHIVDGEGNVLYIHNITASVTPEVLLWDNPDIVKDENTGGYCLSK